MSGGVPKKISISRTQRNTFCKSGGWGQQGLILCGGQRGKKGMCNYIKKRVNHRGKPGPLPPSEPPIETVNFNNPINTGVLGGKNIYQFIANGSLQINLRSPKPNTADYLHEPIKNRCGQITGYKFFDAKTVSFDLEYYMIGGGGAGGQGSNGGTTDFGGGGAAGVVRQGTITVSGQLGTTINVSLEVGTGGAPSGNNGQQSGSGGDTSIQVVGGTTVVAKGGEGGFAGGGGSGGGNGGSNDDFAGGLNTQNPSYLQFRAAGGAGADPNAGAGGKAFGEYLDGGGYLYNYSDPTAQSAGVNVNFANNGWIALPNVDFTGGVQTIGGGGGGACVTGNIGLPGPPPTPGTQRSGFGGQGPPTGFPGLGFPTGTKVGGDGVGGGSSVGTAPYKAGSAGVANTGSGGGGGNFVSPVAVSGYSGGNGFVQVRFLSSLL